MIKLLTCGVLNVFSATICRKKAELYLEKPYQPVYDIIHSNTKKIPLHTPDYLLIISCIFNFSKYILYLLHNDQLFYNTFHKNIDVLIYSLFFRSITTPVTIIPTCMSRPKGRSTSLYAKMFVSTHDLIYSGHTIVFVFFGKILEEEYVKNMYLFITGNIIQYLFPITLILARQHYTIDVIISFLVYNFLYQIS